MTMRFSFVLPHAMELKALTQPWELGVSGSDQKRMIRCADELGYDFITVPEHFVVPHEHVELTGSHYFHSTVAQAFIAGATNQIRVASSVTLLPVQHPIVMAKALSTADWMSGGRIIAAFGIGWEPTELGMLGVPFHERGRMADEYLAAILELWTSDSPNFDGTYVSFGNVAFGPRPVQRPHPPIWIGGDADAALKRAARFGDGWIPFLTPPDDIAARVDFIKSQPEYDGRPFEVMYGLGTSRIGEGHEVVDDPTQRPGMSAPEIIDRLNTFAQWGVTATCVPIPAVRGVDEYLDYAQWVIEEIKPHVA
jgi:probable F420-dependent oxidoreductase